MLGDGKCDKACNKAQCFYDGGDCSWNVKEDSSCTLAKLTNQNCDTECASYTNFFYDNWNCVRPTQPCAPGCTRDLLQNGKCDEVCNSSNCYYDFNDCVGVT